MRSIDKGFGENHSSKFEKLLTISVAAYNIEGYVERCLNSLVIEKKYMDRMEVLIENDGSTDSTAEIAKKFVEKYPNTFKLLNKKNGGYGSTVNNSLKLATGKYFKLLDGDDEFETKNLVNFLNILETTDTDMICTPRVRVLDHTGQRMTIDPFSEKISGENPISILNSPECTISELHMFVVAYKTSVIRGLGVKLPEHTLYTDSIVTFCPLTNSDSVFVSHLPIYVYHVGRDGQSTSLDGLLKHGEESGKIFKYLLDFADVNSKNRTIFSRCFARNCGSLYVTSYMMALPISKNNLKKIKDFDSFVKKRNKIAWQVMSENKAIGLLRKTRYSWIFYVFLH